MTPDQLAAYAHRAAARAALSTIAAEIAKVEDRIPGFVSGLLYLSPERQGEIVWDLYRGIDVIDLRVRYDEPSDAYALYGRPNYPASAGYQAAMIPGAGTPPRESVNEHCIDGHECEVCRYGEMDVWWEEMQLRHGRRGSAGERPAAGDADARLQDWERDLLNG